MPVSDLEETLSLIEAGRADEVLPTLEYLAGLFPISATAHVLLARAYEAEGAWERALAEWQWASTLMPGSPPLSAGIDRCIRVLSGRPDPLPEEPAPPQAAPSVASPAAPEQDEFVDVAGQPDVVDTQAPPVEVVEEIPEPDEEIENLDRLIAELESARITPDPDLANAPVPDLDDEADDMVSETLARIYAAQKQYAEAARVYELLAHQHPGRAREFVKKAAEMRSFAAEQ